MISPKHLKNAYLDGAFYLEKHQSFWSELDKNDFCFGEIKEVGSGLQCQTIKLSNKNKSLLVSLTNTKNKTWYSWIHAD